MAEAPDRTSVHQRDPQAIKGTRARSTGTLRLVRGRARVETGQLPFTDKGNRRTVSDETSAQSNRGSGSR